MTVPVMKFPRGRHKASDFKISEAAWRGAPYAVAIEIETMNGSAYLSLTGLRHLVRSLESAFKRVKSYRVARCRVCFRRKSSCKGHGKVAKANARHRADVIEKVIKEHNVRTQERK